MRSALITIILLLTITGISSGQIPNPPDDDVSTKPLSGLLSRVLTEAQVPPDPLRIKYTNHEPNAVAVADSSLYKRKADWQRIVDEFWGPGLPRLSALPPACLPTVRGY